MTSKLSILPIFSLKQTVCESQPNKQPKEKIHVLNQSLQEVLMQKKSRDKCTPMFTAALFTIARTWKQPDVSWQRDG